MKLKIWAREHRNGQEEMKVVLQLVITLAEAAALATQKMAKDDKVQLNLLPAKVSTFHFLPFPIFSALNLAVLQCLTLFVLFCPLISSSEVFCRTGSNYCDSENERLREMMCLRGCTNVGLLGTREWPKGALTSIRCSKQACHESFVIWESLCSVLWPVWLTVWPRKDSQWA